MKLISLYFLFFFFSISFAQINIQYLNDVPDSFKKKYYSKPRNYNPLQVGNMWQYFNAEYNVYSTIKILQDSIINGKRYFKKSSFPEFTYKPDDDTNISWERNDTVSGVSFMLDFEDVNNNGDYLEELPLDSLENPYMSRYKSYKYSFNHGFFWSGEKEVLIQDTSWFIIEGDTAISRYLSYGLLFWQEEIIEGFGIFWNWSESPARYCTGAFIDGKQYGTIVSVNENVENKPTNFLLGNNYPNPFNPSTTITYSIPKLPNQSLVKVRLLVYDTLGRVITTLVNENKPSGTYSITFKAQGLASGVYYYSLISESNVITKPMILIK